MPKPVLYTSAPVVPQAKTPKSKAGLLTRPFRSLPDKTRSHRIFMPVA